MKKMFPITLVLSFNLRCTHPETSKPGPAPVSLNDIHSQLNPTEHLAVQSPKTIEEIQNALRSANAKGQFISISGGNHSMGGQQFGAGTINLNMSAFNQVIALDTERGIVEVESGIQWPELVAWLASHQVKGKKEWGIRQKQTGADRLSIGGALSSNIHGRGLTLAPIIADVEAFTLIDANAEIKTCSRTENPELFRLVIGGYGLFGVIGTVKLRLTPVKILERVVKLGTVKEFMTALPKHVRTGFLYGDFQFSIDPNSDDFLNRGIYSMYKPTTKKAPVLGEEKELKAEDWQHLLTLAHTDKAQAFAAYSKYYLSTNGQLYRSDTHQMGVYVSGYHESLDQGIKASEMISEIYVPRRKLTTLFEQLRQDFRKNGTNVIYGTVRLIEQDNESFLAWAKQNYAATVFNFHVEHTPTGIELAKQQFQTAIDRALENGGSYYLTYHRWARKDQVLKAYPQFPEFLRLKKKYDPEERFQSEWYRHYRAMFKES